MEAETTALYPKDDDDSEKEEDGEEETREPEKRQENVDWNNLDNKRFYRFLTHFCWYNRNSALDSMKIA